MKLNISKKFKFEVKAKIQDENGEKSHAFEMVAERSLKDEIDQATNANGPTNDFLKKKICDWKGQKLVVDDTDAPVDFSEDALLMMLDVPNMQTIILSAYLNGNGARVKN